MSSKTALRAGTLLCALLSASAAAALAQAVDLRFTPAVGQVTHYKMTSQAWPSGDTTAAPMVTTMYQTRTVTAMDGPNYVVKTVTDSTISPMAGGRDPMRGMAITQHLDPRGRVLSTEMTPPPGLPPFVANMMQRNSGQNSNSNRTAILPDHPLNVGDTWTDTMFTSASAGRGRPQQVSFIVTYKLLRVESQGGSRVAVISMNGTEQGGANGTVTGEMSLDLGAGRLARMNSDMTFEPQPGAGTMRTRMTMEMLP